MIQPVTDLGNKINFGEQNKTARIAAGRLNTGSSTWARTRDLRINSPALYQLSYRGIDLLREARIIAGPLFARNSFVAGWLAYFLSTVAIASAT